MRTARLVAAAVARRVGLQEPRLDEVRLAVGEVCTRAVHRSQEAAVSVPVELRMTEIRLEHVVGYEVQVTDGAPQPDGTGLDVALLLARGVADRVSVGPGPAGPAGTVCLVWALQPL